MLLAQDIRDRERGGRAQIGVVEGGHEKDSPDLMKAMNAVLGQRSGHLKEATPDDAPNTVHNSSVKLYQWAINICPKLALWKSKDVICDDINLFPLGSSVFDNNGNVVVQEVATQPLTQDLLQSSVITLHTPNFRVKDYFFCPVVSESLFFFF